MTEKADGFVRTFRISGSRFLVRATSEEQVSDLRRVEQEHMVHGEPPQRTGAGGLDSAVD